MLTHPHMSPEELSPDQAVNPLKDCWCCLGSYTHCGRCTKTNWFIIADPGHLGWWAKWSAMGVGVKHGRSITYHQSSLSVVNMQPKLSRWVYLAVDSKLIRSPFYQPYAFREYLESFKYFLNLWLVVGHRARVLVKVVSHPLREETLLSSPRAREVKGKAFCPALLPKCWHLGVQYTFGQRMGRIGMPWYGQPVHWDQSLRNTVLWPLHKSAGQ